MRTGRIVDMFLTAILRTGTKNDYLFRFLVPCGDCGVDTTSGLLEILEFTHFFEHVAFEKDADNHVRKVLKKYIRVVVAVDLVEVNTKEA